MPMQTRMWLVVGFVVAGLLTVNGCVSLSKPYVAKEAYAIEVEVPGKPIEPLSDQVLRVRELRVASPYEEQSLMRRLANGTYQRDYYHIYVASPDAMLTGQAMRYLTASGPFAVVVPPSSLATTSLVLEGRVTSLLGDMADPDGPHAVIAAEFFLIDNSSGDALVVMDKSYTAKSPLTDDSAPTLVNALSQAWTQVIASLAQDLGQHTAPPSSH